jgi:hypothetical protein
MIEKYVSDIANQMGIKLSKVSLVEGKSAGCIDVYSLMISSSGCNVSTTIYQTDLEHLNKGVESDRLEARVQHTLSRLQLMIET